MTSLPKTRRISDELGDSSGSSSYHSTHSTQAWNSRLPDVTPAFPLRQKVLEHSSLDSTTSPPTSPGSSSRGRSSRRVSGTMGAPVLGGNSDLRSDAVTRLVRWLTMPLPRLLVSDVFFRPGLLVHPATASIASRIAKASGSRTRHPGVNH
jgi:hypothetical protein